MELKLTQDIVCKIAQQRFRNAALWRNLWMILVLGFGLVLIVFFIVSIIFFLHQDWLPAALTTVGTIVESAGIKWLVNRRKDAVKEEKEAYEEVRVVCRDTNKADKLQSKLTLFGQLR